MSRLYFHARHRDAAVGGSEQAYLGWIARQIGSAVLSLNAAHDDDFELVRRITINPPAHIAELLNTPAPDVMLDNNGYRQWAYWPERWETGVWASGVKLMVGGAPISHYELCLNTLIAMRSPQLTLIAHLAGLDESHIRVEAEHAGWLADVITYGRDTNLFRAGQGWEDVIALCREVAAGKPGPIVTSYSVSDSFPNPDVAQWEAPACVACKGTGQPNPNMKYTDVDYDYCTSCNDGYFTDLWYDLPEETRWDMAVDGLRAKDWPFAMGPDTLEQGYLHGVSMFDVRAEGWVGQLSPVHEK